MPVNQDLAHVFDEIPTGHGAIGLLSSDEFLPAASAFDRALLAATGPRVALLLCADPRAAPHSAALAIPYYRELGADPLVVEVLHRDQATAQALPDYDVLFIGGGSPATLLPCLKGTTLWDEALRRWRSGAAIAGSSAGAMALCRRCLVPRPGDRVPTVWSEGLGPLERVALAVHASSRPPEWLRAVARDAPAHLLALDDATGVVLQAGRPPRVAGPGDVRICTAD